MMVRSLCTIVADLLIPRSPMAASQICSRLLGEIFVVVDGDWRVLLCMGSDKSGQMFTRPV